MKCIVCGKPVEREGFAKCDAHVLEDIEQWEKEASEAVLELENEDGNVNDNNSIPDSGE